MEKRINDQVAIYQLKNGALQLRKYIKHDTVWASLLQISELSDIDKSGISRHINLLQKNEATDFILDIFNSPQAGIQE